MINLSQTFYRNNVNGISLIAWIDIECIMYILEEKKKEIRTLVSFFS